LLDVERYRAELEARPRPADKNPSDWAAECWKRVFARCEAWLDDQPAVCHLSDPRLAQIVVDAMYHFAGERYDLLAFVVMPSHIHWAFQPIEAWAERAIAKDPKRTPREQLLHSLNRFTAYECNKILQIQGTFWQHESYDHWVRDAEELERIILYIEANPVKARLVPAPEQWPFSSAAYRRRAQTELGVPLLRGASL
jgi:type I restriction enzyme R subunit